MRLSPAIYIVYMDAQKVDILGVDISGVDILGVDMLRVDILGGTKITSQWCKEDVLIRVA